MTTMFRVESFEAREIELDFTSSGQGRRKSIAVSVAGECLINALDLIDFDPDSTQVHVCEACGVTHCARGNWVAMRRLGTSVLWTPSWAEMEGGDGDEIEYWPPMYLASKGAPLFSAQAWQDLRALEPEVPAATELPALNTREAVRLLQWSAPGHVLGTFPDEPSLSRESLIAVEDGDLKEIAERVGAAVHRSFAQPEPARAVKRNTADVPIKFLLDLPSCPAWSAFAIRPEGICMVFDEDSAIELAAG